MHEDDRLKRVLHKWEAPYPGAALDHKVLASYRGQRAAQPWWKRGVLVPVPVVIALAVLLVGLFVWRATPRRPATVERDVRSLVAESAGGANYTTVSDFSGFQPAKEPVVRIERKRQ